MRRCISLSGFETILSWCPSNPQQVSAPVPAVPQSRLGSSTTKPRKCEAKTQVSTEQQPLLVVVEPIRKSPKLRALWADDRIETGAEHHGGLSCVDAALNPKISQETRHHGPKRRPSARGERRAASGERRAASGERRRIGDKPRKAGTKKPPRGILRRFDMWVWLRGQDLNL